MPLAELGAAITRATGTTFLVHEVCPLAGGCINQAYKLDDDQRSFFVKVNCADRLSMFEAEATGLQTLLAAQALRAPRPICHGIAANQAFLVLEYLDLSGAGNETALGQQLALLHCVTSAQFGWARIVSLEVV